MRIARLVGYGILGLALPLVLFAAIFIAYVSRGVTDGVAHDTGLQHVAGVRANVRIIRDERGVPHIRAASLHDAFFAEGYAAGSDRLFQMDVTRRFVLGRLTEVFAGTALQSDEAARIVDVRAIANDDYAKLDANERDLYAAYADGVNAAAKREPTPPEFRALGLTFRPWQPQDSIVVGFATILDLSGSWNAVTIHDAVVRDGGAHADEAFYPLTDPAYDTPAAGGKPAPVAPLPPLGAHVATTLHWDGYNRNEGFGSNEFVAGAAHTRTHRALLANDPHLERSIPGIWYLVDVEAPGFHVAGATFAGVPGVILGHNDAVAWGATNGTVASPRVYRETFVSDDGATYRAGNSTLVAESRVETFSDRLGNPHHRTYLRTRHGFVLQEKGLVRDAVQWDADTDRRSPVSAFLALDRARSLDDALRALATYPGPTQNFALAAADGRAAYTMAGHVPLDAAWGTATFDGPSSPPAPLHFVPFTQLPHVAPGAAVVAVNANNRPYGAGYAYRLSPAFTAPYRAAEIAARLRAVPRFDVETFRAIQADTRSVADEELAREIVTALRASHVEGDAAVLRVERGLAAATPLTFDAASSAATAIQRLRSTAIQDLIDEHLPASIAPAYLADGPVFVTLMRALRERPRGWFPNDDRNAFLVRITRETLELWHGPDALFTPYGSAYPVVARHPFAALGYHGWDGPEVPGSGGAYAPAVQGFRLGQSFRAVWDAGNWDGGGIDIPLGESGEPGSPHYRDLADRYARHALTPLPFSDAAVARAARGTLTLAP